MGGASGRRYGKEEYAVEDGDDGLYRVICSRKWTSYDSAGASRWVVAEYENRHEAEFHLSLVKSS